MNSLPRLVGNDLDSTSDAGQNIMVVTNPDSSDNDREIKYLDPANMKIGTSDNYIELNESSSSVSIQSYNTTIGKTGSSSNTALTVSPDNDDITLNSDYGINILAGRENVSTKIKLDPTKLELNASVFNINNCPYIIGNGIIAYNSSSHNPTYDTMIPPITTYRPEYIADLNFQFSSDQEATAIQLWNSSSNPCKLFYAEIPNGGIGKTGGVKYEQNTSESMQDLKFKSTCSLTINNEEYDCAFSILAKMLDVSSHHLTVYLCVISSTYPYNSYYRLESDNNFYLPLALDKRFLGILELADNGQALDSITPGTQDWGIIEQGIPYHFPYDWFDSFGLLDFGRGIVSIKDGKITKKTW